MSERNISTSEATIKTCTVSIKALTLNNKQMTLSVFRQLPVRHIIDPNAMTLLGEPWGLVNYFWNDCGLSCLSHLHVVWSSEDRLLRSCVADVKGRSHDQEWAATYGDTVALRYLGTPQWNDGFQSGSRGYYEVISANNADLVAFTKQWNALYAQLAALDQLFIAV